MMDPNPPIFVFFDFLGFAVAEILSEWSVNSLWILTLLRISDVLSTGKTMVVGLIPILNWFKPTDIMILLSASELVKVESVLVTH